MCDVDIQTSAIRNPTKPRRTASRTNSGIIQSKPIVFCSILLILVFLPKISINAQSISHGTTIIIIRSADSIIVAADSKIQDEYSQSGTFCKIRRVGHLGFASAGILEDKDTEFSIVDIAVKACKGDGTIFDKVQQFERTIREPLLKVFRSMSTRVPPDKIKFQIAFFGFYSNVAFVVTEHYSPVESFFTVTDIKHRRTIIPEYSEIDSVKVILLGQYQEILQQTARAQIQEIDRIELIKILMNIELTQRIDVGGPVDILCLTAKNIQWIQKKQECPD